MSTATVPTPLVQQQQHDVTDKGEICSFDDVTDVKSHNNGVGFGNSKENYDTKQINDDEMQDETNADGKSDQHSSSLSPSFSSSANNYNNSTNEQHDATTSDHQNSLDETNESSPPVDSSTESAKKLQTDYNLKRKRRTNVVIIHSDASIASSPYNLSPPPPSPLSYSELNNYAGHHRRGREKGRSKQKKKKKKKKKKKTSSTTLNIKSKQKQEEEEHSEESKAEQQQETSLIAGSVATEAVSDNAAPNSSSSSHHQPQHHQTESKANATATNTTTKFDNKFTTVNNEEITTTTPLQNNKNINDDPILQHYLPKMTFLNENYYNTIQPYKMGRRNLPENQIELILRRRAVKKHVKKKLSAVDENNDQHHQHHQQQQQQRKSRKAQYHHDGDDLTISSAVTAVSTWTSTTAGSKKQQPASDNVSYNHDSSEYPTQQQQSSTITPTQQLLPQEEIIGDTSLGLKLTILQGKVIIQSIDPLNDGRASPAQLCNGLISPGDILIAVNGKSLINGTIHNPAPMDRIISVLKPLSQPIVDEACGEYSREVRLRLMLGGGIELLREQKAREDRKREDMERRKRLGLDRCNKSNGSGGGGGGDAAGDIFGIASFMAVDQHSGMPLFGHLDDHHYHHQDPKTASNPERNLTTGETDDENDGVEGDVKKCMTLLSPQPDAVPLTLQERIARQVARDRQWMRNRNTSEFFSLDNEAPVLLRPPTPPMPIDDADTYINPIEARRQMLERGSKVMNDAKSLVSLVESEDRRVEGLYADEDPMEVASRVCGTASIRTGASKRRWHRGDSAVIEEERSSIAADASSAADISVESAEECDHRRLVDLAANDDSWKVNVLKRLGVYAHGTEMESSRRTASTPITDSSPETKESHPTSFDAFLFGDDVTSLIGKKKRSLALPPGEMTAMLYDLVDHLETDVLPGQIFIDNELDGASKSVSFSRNLSGSSDDIKNATEFLMKEALVVWLKTFRPLPLQQRRALWPKKQSGGNADASIGASTLDDMSLSMASGSIGTMKTLTPKEKEKRNLREVIEEMELDPETRTETCRLVTFYFTRKCATQNAEEELAALIDAHGAYLDLHQSFVSAGKMRSKLLIEKLLEVAKNDSRHKESLKHLKKANENMLILYEPQMLSALLEILSSSSESVFDITSLLVSAYPELQPWCVRDMNTMDNSRCFYFQYMSSLLHYEEGNDAARRDKELIKEWCLMLLSEHTNDNENECLNREDFIHIASRDSDSSILYYRDLPFLMDTSTEMSEFGLALEIANEIISSTKYRHNKQVLEDVLKHLRIISDVAIKGNDGELNTTLFSQIITFFNVLAPCLEKHQYDFDIITELTLLLEQCKTEGMENSSYNSTNMDACITCVSESAPPFKSLRVFSQWSHSSIESASLVTAIQTSLLRGAREGVRSELSGSLLRIKRAREGRRPIMGSELGSWCDTANDDVGEDDEEDEAGGGSFIWKRVLDGTLKIAK